MKVLNRLDAPLLRAGSIVFWFGVLLWLPGMTNIVMRYWEPQSVIKVFVQHLIFADNEYQPTGIGFYVLFLGFCISYGYDLTLKRLIKWVRVGSV